MMELLELIGDAVMERDELLEDIARIEAEIAARAAAFFAQCETGCQPTMGKALPRGATTVGLLSHDEALRGQAGALGLSSRDTPAAI